MNVPAHSKPTLIITGAGGLVGGRLALVAEGRFEVVNISRASGVDLTKPDEVDAALALHDRAAAVIHLAAWTDVSRAHAQTDDRKGPCWRLNVDGTRNLLRAARRHRMHVVHVSTDFVFDGEKSGAYTEEDLPGPIEWYGRSKLAAEEAVRQERDWTIIRTAFPYSAGAATRPDLVWNIHRKLAEGGEVNLFTDQIITPTLIDDLAHGLLLAARIRPRGEVYHLVGSTSLTPFDLGLKIARAFHFDAGHVRPGLMAEHMKRDPRPRHKRLRLSNAKWTAFATLHGLHPPVGIDEGIARVVERLGQSAPDITGHG